MIEVCTEAYVKGKSELVAKDPNDKGQLAKASNWLTKQLLFQVVGARYRNKEEAIEKWMLEAKLKQDKYDFTNEPEGVRCPSCNKPMHVRIKHLETLDDTLRMMFLFGCDTCDKKSWIYEDGQVYPSTPILCSKCQHEATISTIEQGKDKVVWKTSCSSCGFSEITTDDFTKSRIENEEREKEERSLLEKYQENYCSDTEGQKALEYIDALPVADEVYKEQLKKYDSQAYLSASSVKKLTIIELERILKPQFQKERYSNLVFSQPEIGRYIIVTFTIQDADPRHRSHNDLNNLKKLLKDTLERTNWRLMTDSLSNRLGYVTGRLKGYESERDIFELVGMKPEVKETKISSEQRSKYESGNVVQLAKIMGEIRGTQNARKHRLKNEPDGFLLEDDQVYSCSICGEQHTGYETWWNLDGSYCDDCHRNLSEKLIPNLGKRIDKDKTYFANWQLSSDSYFGIHASTARKLRKQDLLHGYDLTRKNGDVYFTVYLYSENQEFLKQYPQKERQKMIITDLLGEQMAI